jgi:hypothetical protein
MKASFLSNKDTSPYSTVEDVLSIPGKALDEITVEDANQAETPLRGYEDLKQQYFGPTIFNKQRLNEAGDIFLYQTAYAAPGALTGYLIGEGDLRTTLLGLGLGKLIGQGYVYNKEQKRLDEALKTFNPTEKKLLNKINNTSRKWAIGGALLGGLGVGGLSFLTKRDLYGSTATPIIEGVGGAMLAGLAGNLVGHYLAKEEARKDKQFKAIIKKYDKFD